MPQKTAPSVWKIFAREPSSFEDAEDYAAECYRAGVIALGWSDVGDLNNFSSKYELQRQMVSQWRNYRKRPRSLAQATAALWHFKVDVRKGDWVLCPDRIARSVYVGRILSRDVFYDEAGLDGQCKFAHRRKVKWLRILDMDAIHHIWPNGRFGGLQTVSRIKSTSDLLRNLEKGKFPNKNGHKQWHPDKEWGRAAEIRAMAWLKSKGKFPKDVSKQNCGWDIECDQTHELYEVKGRKSHGNAVHLTENEWKAAQKHGKKYTLLIFTASTEEILKKVSPVQIPDPTRTREWTPKIHYDFILSD